MSLQTAKSRLIRYYDPSGQQTVFSFQYLAQKPLVFFANLDDLVLLECHSLSFQVTIVLGFTLV